MAYLQAKPTLSVGLLDSTVVRAHASAVGTPLALPKKGRDPALGRGRGGLGTQIHILADQRGCPLCLRLTDGQRHDSTQRPGLWSRPRPARPCPV